MATEEATVTRLPDRADPALNAVALQTPQPMMPATIPGAGGAYDFAPKDLPEALKLADILASSTMVPKDFIGKPGNCFIAMQWGTELGFKPLQAIQNIAVINGRPGLYGDAGKALLQARRYRIDLDDTEVVKVNGVARCTITAPNGHVTSRTFSLDDARQAKLWDKDGPWKLYPYRQMSWRAFWFCARDAAADVLKGMGGVEELRDMTPEREVTSDTPAEVVRTPAPPDKASKSDRIAAGLKKATPAEVGAAFDNAKDKEQLAAAVESARKAELTVEERAAVNEKYHAAKKRILPEAAPTVQDVQQMLKNAKNVDALDVAGSLIDSLACEPDLKAALTNDYKTLRNELTKE